ncbi:undecaprenyl-diphosphatase [Nocardioides alpinus]|uniref:Undecaprenyl-diphosphatase n=1 Tax=Nocardioides alpinus TaxID=748909 RepID=A0A1I0ZA64_9ACTN|nr:phosphatase PAP2 family protein [Nocardioides alpinus]SFB22534.1 undecaprenyl-diphosphatase [Nocardioides alpinus]
MDETSTRRDAARTLATWWVVLLLGVLAVGWLITQPLESTVDPWDDSVERWIAERRTPGLDTAAAWGSHLADTIVGVALAAVIAVVAWRKQGTRRPLVYYGVLVVGTLALYLVVTALITRDRPPVEILDPGLVPDHSFPSGHVATSIVVYAATAVFLARTVPGASRWVWPLYLVPVVVVPSRLYEGAHHPTDVLTSVVFASVWVAVVARVVLAPSPEPREP